MPFKNYRSFLLGVFSLFLILFFQNCKSQHGFTGSSEQFKSNNPGTMTFSSQENPLNNGIDFTSVQFQPQKTPQGVEVFNPNKGFYQFNPKIPLPETMMTFDSYVRVAWDVLEPSIDSYDFTIIENQLKTLKPGGRIGLRIMPLNTCCSSEKVIAADVPDYMMEGDNITVSSIGKHGWYYYYNGKNFFIPDWNDEFFLKRVEKLVSQLAKKYDGDPRVNWVEIGLYGNWGEWHTYPLMYPVNEKNITISRCVEENKKNGTSQESIDCRKLILDTYNIDFYSQTRTLLYAPLDTSARAFREGTDSSKDRILNAHINGFKKTQLISLSADIRYLVKTLKSPSSKPIGFRRDSWGASEFSNLEEFQNYKLSSDDLNLIFNRWKVAPFYTESWGYSRSKEISKSMDVLQQIEFFHTSSIAYAGFFPTEGFSYLSVADQTLFQQAGNRAGFRYSISQVSLDYQNNNLRFSSTWQNEGIAPTYDEWQIIAYLYNDKTNNTLSSLFEMPIDLKTLYNDSDDSVEIARLIQNPKPDSAAQIQNIFQKIYEKEYTQKTVSIDIPVNLSTLSNQSSVELRVVIKHRLKYLMPLRLGIENLNSDGSYTLYKIK